MASSKRHTLEDRLKHPETMKVSNYYSKGDADYEIEYIIDDLKLEDGKLSGNLTLIIKKKLGTTSREYWRSKNDNEYLYKEIFRDSLDNVVIIENDDFNRMERNMRERSYESRLERYLDFFSMSLKEDIDTMYEKDIVPSILDKTLEALYLSVLNEYANDIFSRAG